MQDLKCHSKSNKLLINIVQLDDDVSSRGWHVNILVYFLLTAVDHLFIAKKTELVIPLFLRGIYIIN